MNSNDRMSPNIEIFDAPSTLPQARIHHDCHANGAIHKSDHGRIWFYTLISIFALVDTPNRSFMLLHLVKCDGYLYQHNARTSQG